MSVELAKERLSKLQTDGCCSCSSSDACPLGRVGSSPRCKRSELEEYITLKSRLITSEILGAILFCCDKRLEFLDKFHWQVCDFVQPDHDLRVVENQHLILKNIQNQVAKIKKAKSAIARAYEAQFSTPLRRYDTMLMQARYSGD